MNNFSTETLKALFAQETDKIFYLLLTIDPDHNLSNVIKLGDIVDGKAVDSSGVEIGELTIYGNVVKDGVVVGVVKNGSEVYDRNDLGIVAVYNSNEYENGEPRMIKHHDFDYVACPFTINLPNQGNESSNEVTLTVSNVDRALTDAVRSQSKPFKIKLEVVMSDSVDVTEAGPWNMQLTNITLDALTIEGTVIADRFMNEPFPSKKMDATNFPTMF